MTRMMKYSLCEGLGITGTVSIGANCARTLIYAQRRRQVTETQSKTNTKTHTNTNRKTHSKTNTKTHTNKV